MTAPQTEGTPGMIPDPDYDPLSVLTLAELDSGSRMLKTDLIYQCTHPGAERRWEALAIACWLLARRDNHRADLKEFRDMTTQEFNDFMVARTPLIPAPVDPPAEGDGTDAAAIADEVEANPSEPGPGS